MGAWDHGIYDNDDALDFLFEITDGSGLGPVEEALQRVNANAEDYLQADSGQLGLVAADVVAAVLGKPGLGTPDELTEWIEKEQPTAGPPLLAAARAAVARILAPQSEIRDLWEESEEADAWVAKVQDLAARLQSAG